jgi:hypothetical protein
MPFIHDNRIEAQSPHIRSVLRRSGVNREFLLSMPENNGERTAEPRHCGLTMGPEIIIMARMLRLSSFDKGINAIKK